MLIHESNENGVYIQVHCGSYMPPEVAVEPTYTRRVHEMINEVLAYPDPYNFKRYRGAERGDLAPGELSALLRAFDGYGLRDMLTQRYGSEYERRMWERANQQPPYVVDPLEWIQDIP